MKVQKYFGGITNMDDLIINWGEEDKEHKVSYFKALRQMIEEIYFNGSVTPILEKYNIHFIDVDDIPRVNIDFPKNDQA